MRIAAGNAWFSKRFGSLRGQQVADAAAFAGAVENLESVEVLDRFRPPTGFLVFTQPTGELRHVRRALILRKLVEPLAQH